jgi:hypothetical protein
MSDGGRCPRRRTTDELLVTPGASVGQISRGSRGRPSGSSLRGREPDEVVAALDTTRGCDKRWPNQLESVFGWSPMSEKRVGERDHPISCGVGRRADAQTGVW